MIRLLGALGTLAVLAYSGAKLLKELDKEDVKDKESCEDETCEDQSSCKEQYKADLLKEEAKLVNRTLYLQKEISRLHEIFMTAKKLTTTGSLKDLDIKIEGTSLDKAIENYTNELYKTQAKINQIRKELNNLEKN